MFAEGAVQELASLGVVRGQIGGGERLRGLPVRVATGRVADGEERAEAFDLIWRDRLRDQFRRYKRLCASSREA